jgi:hypothetical protein
MTTPHSPPKVPSIPQSLASTGAPADLLLDQRNRIIARMALAWLHEHEPEALSASPVDVMALVECLEQAHGVILPSAVIKLLGDALLGKPPE